MVFGSRVFLGHFFASVFLLFVLSIACLFYWYPGVYARDDLLVILAILVIVDLCLGPLITAVVYKPGRAGAVRDVACILVVQLAAFIYGAHSIFSQRPCAQLLDIKGLHVLNCADLRGIPLVEQESKTEAVFHLPTYYLDLPADESSIRTIEMVHAFTEGKSLLERTDLFKRMPADANELVLFYLKKALSDKDRGCVVLPVFLRNEELTGCVNIDNWSIVSLQ